MALIIFALQFSKNRNFAVQTLRLSIWPSRFHMTGCISIEPYINWCGSVTSWPWTCDQQVAGSTPGRRIAGQRLWTSRSHMPSASIVTTVWRYRSLI